MSLCFLFLGQQRQFDYSQLFCECTKFWARKKMEWTCVEMWFSFDKGLVVNTFFILYALKILFYNYFAVPNGIKAGFQNVTNKKINKHKIQKHSFLIASLADYDTRYIWVLFTCSGLHANLQRDPFIRDPLTQAYLYGLRTCLVLWVFFTSPAFSAPKCFLFAISNFHGHKYLIFLSWSSFRKNFV